MMKERDLLQPRHECIVNCVGMIDVMSTSFLKQATHILEGLWRISMPQTQHSMVGMAPYSSPIFLSPLFARMNEWWPTQTDNTPYHGRTMY
jgi:hypothetical protein